MQTPMILNPVSVNQQAAPSGKPDDKAPEDPPFSRILAHQVAYRSNHSSAKKTSDDTDIKRTAESTSVEAGEKIDKADEANQNPIDATPLPFATAELLALVVDIHQPAEKLENTRPAKDDKLPKVDDGLDSVIGEGGYKHTSSVTDRAFLENMEKQDLYPNAGAGKPAPDLIQSLDKKDDTRLLMDTATSGKHDSPPTTISANMVASQAIAQEIGQVAKDRISDKLTPYVGSSAWNQALGQKITLMVGEAQQTATLSLNPPDLGPLQIVLNISKESADATFIAAQPEVRQALEAALPKLREMMNEAGIQLGQTNVSSNMPDQHNAQSESGSKMNAQAIPNSPHSEDLSPAPLVPSRAIQLGLIDAFA